MQIWKTIFNFLYIKNFKFLDVYNKVKLNILIIMCYRD